MTITHQQENTLERLLGYAEEELLSNHTSHEPKIRESIEQKNVMQAVGRIQSVINSFYILMAPRVYLDIATGSEEYNLLKNEFENRFMEELPFPLPSLDNITPSNHLAFLNFESLLNIKYEIFIQKMALMASTDYLTNLSTSHILNTELESILKKQKSSHLRANEENNFTLGIIDLNYLGKINDTYGHNAGDAYIRAIAEKLKLLFREDDIIARTGGDEITFISKTSKPENIAKKIEENYKEICEYADKKIKEAAKDYSGNISFCVGLASSEDVKSADDLKSQADSASYFSKAICKSPALKRTNEGDIFFNFSLLNRPDGKIRFNSPPSPGEIVQIYNPDYDLSPEQGTKGVGSTVSIYDAARALLKQYKNL